MRGMRALRGKKEKEEKKNATRKNRVETMLGSVPKYRVGTTRREMMRGSDVRDLTENSWMDGSEVGRSSGRCRRSCSRILGVNLESLFHAKQHS
jgi:hypothetical protein